MKIKEGGVALLFLCLLSSAKAASSSALDVIGGFFGSPRSPTHLLDDCEQITAQREAFQWIRRHIERLITQQDFRQGVQKALSRVKFRTDSIDDFIEKGGDCAGGILRHACEHLDAWYAKELEAQRVFAELTQEDDQEKFQSAWRQFSSEFLQQQQVFSQDYRQQRDKDQWNAEVIRCVWSLFSTIRFVVDERKRPSESIAPFIQSMPWLRSFCLEDMRLEDDLLAQIVAALHQSPSITHVSFAFTRFKIYGLRDWIANTQTLISLNLEGAKLGDAGVFSFKDAIGVNRSLVSLNLRWNEITAAGAEALALALEVNLTLKELDLFMNVVGDYGAFAFIRLLERNQTLTALNLGDNHLTLESASAFAQSIRMRKCPLEKLDLSCNYFGGESIRLLERAKFPGDLDVRGSYTQDG